MHSTLVIVGSSLLGAVVLILGLRMYMQSLRARGRAGIDKLFPASDVLLSETLAQSFGQESKGATQLRGSGALALTSKEIYFAMYVPARELRIPLTAVEAVSLVRSHLGKTQIAQLLHVRFVVGGVTDSIAWRLPDPSAWKAKIESLRA